MLTGTWALLLGIIMKFSTIIEIVQAYESAQWSPSRMSVHLGCDCGCGGDDYTPESWDEEEREADKAIAEAMNLCRQLGIEYDGIE